MSRTITVKGVGRVSTPPDYIVISMSLEAQDTNYEKAMEQAARSVLSAGLLTSCQDRW